MVEVTWAEGWGPDKLRRHDTTPQTTPYSRSPYDGQILYPSGRRVWGLKAPSRYVSLRQLYELFTTGKWLSRRGYYPRYEGEDQRCDPCSATAVHLAIHPEFSLAASFYRTDCYVGVMTAVGAHGTHPANLKWYGKSYRLVARLQVPGGLTIVSELNRGAIRRALLAPVEAEVTT